MPDELGDAQAAATPIAFATAWHMLFTMGGLRAGETVLINSVASGIGSAALQLATLTGAFTIGTASSREKLDRAEALGLERAIDYTRESVPDAVMEATGGAGADLVFEHVGGDSFQRGLDALSRNGRMVVAGGHAGEVVPFDIIPFFRGQKRVLGSSAFTSDEVRTVLALAAHGRVTPLVHAALPLAEARAATELLEGRGHFGKVVLLP
ncbi:MAG: zinc-binding dehydrogenase [Thermoleophilia bacterium]